VAPSGRRTPTLEVVGGGGGARPNGAGTGGLPLPTTVFGRFGASTELIRGRKGTSTDMVDVGRSANRLVTLEMRITTSTNTTFGGS
jgi:hypothetical protein